jgi:O-antigen/teichoic acid export membrane protein
MSNSESLSAKSDSIPLSASAHRSSFFRQSGWLMIANIGGGALMWAVHFLTGFLKKGQYGDFGAFLAFLMLLPNIPLQMTLTQQTAKALANNNRHQLSAVIRMFLLGSAAIWLVGALVVLCFQGSILAHLKLTQPSGLWVTLVIVLLALWLPMFWGMLQGQQNFLWLGWSMMINGVGRLGGAAVAVIALNAGATGMMAGVLLGYLAAVGLAGWHSRGLWLAAPQSFDWRGILRQVVPMLVAFIGFQILFTADTILVKDYFPKADADYYVGAGTLSRALLWLVLPLASVMFPRLVHSDTKSEKSNLMGMVLLGTAGLSIVGALGLALLGPFIVPLLPGAFKNNATQICALLPWYGAAMVPLAVSNVLLNQLLVRPDSKLALAAFVLIAAIAYIFALSRFHTHPVTVLQVMGIANVVLLAICAVFSLRKRPSTA